MSKTVERVIPYADDHAASVSRSMRRGRPPKGLDSLIRWYSAGWEMEAPARLHVPGVWHDAEAHSALGAPQEAPDWRAYLYQSAYQVDADGYYIRPMHAALERMTGRGTAGVYPFMSRYLLQLAFGAWDWKALGARWGMQEELAHVYTETALTRLWDRWREMPDVRPSRRDDDAA